jgi:hypothetical protein
MKAILSQNRPAARFEDAVSKRSHADQTEVASMSSEKYLDPGVDLRNQAKRAMAADKTTDADRISSYD